MLISMATFLPLFNELSIVGNLPLAIQCFLYSKPEFATDQVLDTSLEPRKDRYYTPLGTGISV
jgi:hypothetical protein